MLPRLQGSADNPGELDSRLSLMYICMQAWDFWYYGNKLFQTEFIQILQPGVSQLAPLFRDVVMDLPRSSWCCLLPP